MHGACVVVEREDLGFAALGWDWDRECGRKERERFVCMVMMVVEQEHRMETTPDQAYMLEQRHVDCGDSL